MPDQNNDNNQNLDQQTPIAQATDGIISELVTKVNDSRNILVALSKNPSVDEISAAIGLSMYLNRIGKNATAIYSGETPNALEFLKPEETFERSADVLQDFVIALDKNKADHLRYKVDGDFVKIYITPYKTKVSGGDLDFSYGDFNVDLVFALDVSNGVELDSALREHGRIMHDAVIVNVTTSAPGKFGEIEWSDQSSSSISEMIAKLLFSREEMIEPDEATALLTGIVAATNSFSNAKTTSETMKVSSQLMDAGANQQLVSMHINSETENELYETSSTGESSDFTVSHEDEPSSQPEEIVPEPAVDEPVLPEPELTFEPVADETPVAEPVMAESVAEPVAEPIVAPAAEPVQAEPIIDYGAQGVTLTPPENYYEQPASDDFDKNDDTEKYGKMLEEALSEQENINPAANNVPVTPVEPEVNGVPVINYTPAVDEMLAPAPTPPVNTENGIPFVETPIEMPVEATVVPEAQAMVEPVPVDNLASEQVPETPAVPEVPAASGMPVMPEAPVEPVYAEPVQQPQGQVYTTTSPDDPSAFKIPNVN